jgi:hypothetical protein
MSKKEASQVIRASLTTRGFCVALLNTRQWLTLTEECELPGVESAAKLSAELATEHPAQHLHGQEEVGS